MAIKVRGKLTIKYRTGRNGKFPIGYLVCEIGEFTVKNQALEQYSEGTYEGEFVISRIEIASYTFNGSVNSYMLARLDDFSIDNYETGKVVEPERVMPDPADEEKPTQQPADKCTPQVSDNTDDDFNLFGEELLEMLNRNVSVIKLDPSVDRSIFRQQTKRMRELGYWFKATTQTWHKA